MLLLLARHGNTFEPSDKVVWVGARTDLPLTAKGREQAAALGEGLKPMKSAIRRIVSGPLQRTRDHAGIAARSLNFTRPIEIDERLREIDYGLWEAKSTEEIAAMGGADELQAWDKSGVWPVSPGWSPSHEAIAADVRHLAQGLAASIGGDDAALLVSSNGILKFFLKLVPGAFEDMAARGLLKVATGRCCALTREAGAWRVVFWNRQPGSLAFG
jgi:broad specificity phosphatase PhoE